LEKCCSAGNFFETHFTHHLSPSLQKWQSRILPHTGFLGSLELAGSKSGKIKRSGQQGDFPLHGPGWS
jgi:hypothetical protein